MNQTKDICANCEQQNLSEIANLQEENRQLLLQNNDLKLRAHKAEYQLKDVDETLKAEGSQRTNRVSVIEDMRRELAITRKEVEQLQQFAQEAYVSKRALGLACKAIDIKSECPYWNEAPIAACPSNVADFPCDRSSEDCWIEYFMEEAKQ